jgi:3-oxoacyl-[acyl-carrier-protein] synthase III
LPLPEVWLCAPAVRLPPRRETNDDAIARVRACFRGDADTWRRLERRIRFLFAICGTDIRWFFDEPRPVAGHAAGAVTDVLAREGIAAGALDAVLYTGIAREYFEPATAAEVAARIGATRAMALDVGAACAGMIAGVHDLVARMALDDALRLGVACSTSGTEDHLSYDIQSPEDLDLLGAGLTIGNGCGAWLVGREPFRAGGRVRGVHVECWSEHQDIARTPTRGPFSVRSQEMFELQRHGPGFLTRSAAKAGWEVPEVDLWVVHQPSNRSVRETADALSIPRERMPELHQLFGNTETSSVPLSLDTLITRGAVRPGMKVVLGSAAAGFVLASVAVEWDA